MAGRHELRGAGGRFASLGKLEKGGGTQVRFEMVKNRFPQLIAKVNERAEVIEKQIKEGIADRARALVRVDTGATQGSITVTDDGVEAGEAALFLEFGTVKMPAYPFLGPASVDAKTQFSAEFASIFAGIGRLPI